MHVVCTGPFLFASIECALFYYGDRYDAGRKGGIRGQVREEYLAGEDQGQPGTTGKPPLALASLLSYIAMHMLWFMKLYYSVGDGVAAGTPTLLRIKPPQWVMPLV